MHMINIYPRGLVLLQKICAMKTKRTNHLWKLKSLHHGYYQLNICETSRIFFTMKDGIDWARWYLENHTIDYSVFIDICIKIKELPIEFMYHEPGTSAESKSYAIWLEGLFLDEYLVTQNALYLANKGTSCVDVLKSGLPDSHHIVCIVKQYQISPILRSYGEAMEYLNHLELEPKQRRLARQDIISAFAGTWREAVNYESLLNPV